MNDLDLDLCLEAVLGHVNHCVTFAIEYLGNRWRQRLGSKGPPISNGLWVSNGHVTDDVT